MFTRSIRFDRVFGRHRIVRGRVVTTAFGFEADGTKVLEARIAGDHDVPVGVALTVALRHENAWTTLLGWVDHSSGRLVCGSAPDGPLHRGAVRRPLAVFARLAFATLRDPSSIQGARAIFVCAMTLLALATAALMIREAWFVLRARRFLMDTLEQARPSA